MQRSWHLTLRDGNGKLHLCQRSGETLEEAMKVAKYDLLKDGITAELFSADECGADQEADVHFPGILVEVGAGSYYVTGKR